MNDAGVKQSVSIIFTTWVAFLLLFWVFWSTKPFKKLKYTRLNWREFRKMFRKTPRLCVKHIRTSIRLGEMALLDINRCDQCLKEVD